MNSLFIIHIIILKENMYKIQHKYYLFHKYIYSDVITIYIIIYNNNNEN